MNSYISCIYPLFVETSQTLAVPRIISVCFAVSNKQWPSRGSLTLVTLYSLQLLREEYKHEMRNLTKNKLINKSIQKMDFFCICSFRSSSPKRLLTTRWCWRRNPAAWFSFGHSDYVDCLLKESKEIIHHWPFTWDYRPLQISGKFVLGKCQTWRR